MWKGAGLSPEVRQVLDKGNDFLDKIHRSNDAIPGEEISRKISRMELIIAKIFERAKAHPEIIPDPEPPYGLLSSYDCEAFECI